VLLIDVVMIIIIEMVRHRGSRIPFPFGVVKRLGRAYLIDFSEVHYIH
jgi:hypothetical protein